MRPAHLLEDASTRKPASRTAVLLAGTATVLAAWWSTPNTTLRTAPVTAAPAVPSPSPAVQAEVAARILRADIAIERERAWYQAHRERFHGRSFAESRDAVDMLLRVEDARQHLP